MGYFRCGGGGSSASNYTHYKVFTKSSGSDATITVQAYSFVGGRDTELLLSRDIVYSSPNYEDSFIKITYGDIYLNWSLRIKQNFCRVPDGTSYNPQTISWKYTENVVNHMYF